MWALDLFSNEGTQGDVVNVARHYWGSKHRQGQLIDKLIGENTKQVNTIGNRSTKARSETLTKGAWSLLPWELQCKGGTISQPYQSKS